MSYSIGYVIYGVPFTESMEVLASEELMDNATEQYMEEYIEEHFDFRYSGCSDIRPGWCGILLDTINVFDNTLVKNIKLQPSEQDIQDAKSKIDFLPDDIKKLCDPIDVYIIWGTS